MATLPSLDTLSPSQVIQNHAEIMAVLAERYPTLDFTEGGVLDGLVSQIHALIGTAQATANENALAARSLLAFPDTAENVDPAMVDLVLSNFRVARQAGSAATGEALIVVRQQSTVVVAAGTIFRVGELEFVNQVAYTGRPANQTMVQTTDRPLQPYQGTLFAFSVPLVAVETGPASNIRRGTVLSAAIGGSVTQILANTDFIGGKLVETNSDMLRRLETGVAAHAWGGRANIRAMLMDNQDFGIQALSIVGMEQPEQLRDRQWLLPVASGGKIDLFVRTSGRPETVVHEISASCVSIGTIEDTWQLAISTEQIAGCYHVLEITSTTSGKAATRIDQTNTVGSREMDRTHSISSDVEAAFTVFQGVSCRFTMPAAAGITIGSTAKFRVVTSTMPGLLAIQEFCSGYDTGPPAADVVVRGALPCEVTVDMRVYAPVGAVVDTAAVRSALTAYINGSGIAGQISVGNLAAVAKTVLASDQQVGETALVGRFLGADGSQTIISSIDVLRCPQAPDKLLTKNTVAFMTDIEAVSVSVEFVRPV